MHRFFWKRTGLVALGAALFMASAYAAKECDDFEQEYPGVDENGNLADDIDHQGVLQCRVCANTKNGKFRKKCAGTVVNDSGANQKYKDDPIFAGNGIKPIFIVKANGAAKFREKGVLK